MVHLDDEQIDCYALNRMRQAELADVEEHLLICRDCQRRVQVTTDLIKDLRESAKASIRVTMKAGRNHTVGIILLANVN